MSEFTAYRKKQLAEMRPYVEGETLDPWVSIGIADRQQGSPKAGDMIARNPTEPDDQWLVSAEFFAANYEPV